MNRQRRYYKSNRDNKKYTINKSIKPKSVYDNVHLVKRYGSILQGRTVVDYIDNPTSNQSYKLSFSLDSVTAYEDFTKLYDQYKIRAVKVSFIPMVNITSATLSGYASLIYTTYDFNSNSTTTPPSRDEIREYQYCKWSPYGEIHERYFFPRTIEYVTGIAASTKVGPQNWVSTENADAPYYGLMVNVANVPSIDVGEPIYKVEVRYYLSFRNTK